MQYSCRFSKCLFRKLVGVQLKESFQHYKRLKAAKREKNIPDTIHRDQVKVKTNKTLKKHGAVRQRNYRL